MSEVFILIAEDDADDRFLLQTAFEEKGYKDKLEFVENGMEIKCETGIFTKAT